MFLAVALAAAAVGVAASRLTRLGASHPPAAHATLAPELAAYLGVFEPGSPPGYGAVAGFAQVAGRQPNLLGYYSGWAQPFDMSFAQTIRKHGVIPFVQIDPTDASIAAIAAGTYDDYLRAYADSVRDFRPRRGHRLRARDERRPGTRGVTGTCPGPDLRGRVAAHRNAVPRPGRRQRHLAVDGPGRRGWHRAGRLLVARRAVRHLGRASTGTTTVPPTPSPASSAGPSTRSGPSPASRCCCRRPRSGPRPASSPRSRTCSTGWPAYKTLGLVWFDKAQHGGIYHQDWRIEDSLQAEISFRLGVRDELAPARPAGSRPVTTGSPIQTDFAHRYVRRTVLTILCPHALTVALDLWHCLLRCAGKSAKRQSSGTKCAVPFRRRHSCLRGQCSPRQVTPRRAARRFRGAAKMALAICPDRRQVRPMNHRHERQLAGFISPPRPTGTIHPELHSETPAAGVRN